MDTKIKMDCTCDKLLRLKGKDDRSNEKTVTKVKMQEKANEGREDRIRGM